MISAYVCLAFMATTALASSKPYMYPQSGKSLQQENQYLECYDEPGNTGKHFRFLDYAPSLAPYDLDNVISSCCFNGIWILYDETDYNSNNFGAAVYNGWGEGFCTDFDATFDNKASSVRFSGAPDGYKLDTINFYESKYFMGQEQYFYEDAPQFDTDNLGQSVIVTGCSAWTIYEYDNYQGESRCLYPSDTANCYPSFYAQPSDLGLLASQVSSARKGCFSKNIIHGKTIYPAKGSSKLEHSLQFSAFWIVSSCCHHCSEDMGKQPLNKQGRRFGANLNQSKALTLSDPT